jgi:3-dehydrosphinganine reductase
MMDFQNKNVLISGGSSGIGFALAKQFVTAGANVTILARRKELLKDARSELLKMRQSDSQLIAAISADVCNYESLRKTVQGKVDQIDILINSAGIAYPGEFIEMDAKIFSDVIQTNYLGTVYLTKLVVPGIVKRRCGYIVNISSLAALIGEFGYSAYAPSKYAVRGFSRCLRSELKAYGIDVSVVFPPDTDTPQLAFEHSIIPEITRKINKIASIMSPEKVASYIIKEMKKKRFTIIPGLEGKIGIAFSSIIGRYYYHFAVKEKKKQIS